MNLRIFGLGSSAEFFIEDFKGIGRFFGARGVGPKFRIEVPELGDRMGPRIPHPHS